MSLRYALLALVADRPRSTYELDGLVRRLAPIWTTGRDEVAPVLAELVVDGLVEVAAANVDGAVSRTYATTDDGRAALARWVVTAPKPRSTHDELALKAQAAWVAPSREAVAMFRNAAASHRAQASAYEVERDELVDAGATERRDEPVFGGYLAMCRGIQYERGRAQWCEWVADQLEGRGEATLLTPPEDEPVG